MTNIQLNIGASWEEVKEKIKERNVQLTDEDLQYEPGKEDALLQRLSAKMHRSVEEVKNYIESISHNNDAAAG
ncbi:general stress protein CsbD [Pseudoflavitalea sp. G-6-1-2]|uniref:general stress protein CsbD n=1 Tax=Pseudoflavitalea sp. G-6-1-2 TaxID=2728841 RepID=UPI001469C8F7|nr:general stress protein CsbD [Pseudoflavitalea sp. G-6-1-2]NML19888.1 general stress protein CsbD [Pseudoflavitalea sp. G-6-1-2]